MRKIGVTLKKLMMLNKTYTVYKESLNDSLDYIIEFEERIERFKQRHSSCRYKLDLNQIEDRWKIEITINNEKEYNTQTSREITGPR